VAASSGDPGPRIQAFVRWTLRHGRTLWIVALLLAVPAFWRTAQLYMHLKSDLDELLPKSSESVVALNELRARMPGMQYLGVLVDVGDAKNLPAGERLLDDLAARVRTYPPDLVRSARTGIAEERAFVKKHAPLYLDLADLQKIEARVQTRKDYEAAHALGASLDDDEKPPPVDFQDIEDKYKQRDDSAGRFPNDRFSDAGQKSTLLLVEVGGMELGADKAHRLLERVKADLAALGGPEKYAPGMRVGYTGDVAIAVEELSALVADLTLSTLLVVAAVIAVIVMYFRWWRSIPILIAPLLLATTYAFAIVTLPPFRVDALNSNTAFLGSIIIGNGINFGIVLLARYAEERRHGAGVEDALTVGIWGTRSGTLAAALAAGTAYLALVSTQFRGFRQFGVIGGIGMILAWVTAFVLMPSLIAFVDRGAKSAPRPGNPKAGFMARIAKVVARWPVPVVVIGALVTAGAAWKVRKLDRTRLEYDFSKLRRADSPKVGEQYWGAKMDSLLGRYLTPTVVLADTSAGAAAAAKALREAAARPPLDARVAKVTTVADVLPGDQDAKLAVVESIRTMLTPRIRESIPADKRKQLEDVLGEAGEAQGAGTGGTPTKLERVTAEQLPATFTTGLRERDGRLDCAVLVYPRPSDMMWQGESLIDFARQLRDVTRRSSPSGLSAPRIAGSAPLSADIIVSIERDGPLATFAALAGVVVVVLLVLRKSTATLHVIGSLVVGVLWLTALTFVLDVKINFCNFIAFPITFGIGVDYSVNIVSRFIQDGSRDVTGAIRSTGSAVGLCSLTTIIGYSSLLVAENRALFSFGLVAVLGEIACLTTAVVLMPAVLLLLRGKRADATE
jgi:hypothetical protein